jgi:hypothetical protein
VVRGDGLLDRHAQVLPQVLSVGELPGLRCSGTGGVGVGLAAVAAHDADPGVAGEPVCHWPRFAALDDLYRAAGLQIDQDRRVLVPST